MAAGVPQAGQPLRLPDIDEMKRKAPRPESPGEGGILGPAHSLVARHSAAMPIAPGVGLAGGPGPRSPNRGRARVAAVDAAGEEHWTTGMGTAT